MTSRLVESTFVMRTGKAFFCEADHHWARPPTTTHDGSSPFDFEGILTGVLLEVLTVPFEGEPSCMSSECDRKLLAPAPVVKGPVGPVSTSFGSLERSRLLSANPPGLLSSSPSSSSMWISAASPLQCFAGSASASETSVALVAAVFPARCCSVARSAASPSEPVTPPAALSAAWEDCASPAGADGDAPPSCSSRSSSFARLACGSSSPRFSGLATSRETSSCASSTSPAAFRRSRSSCSSCSRFSRLSSSSAASCSARRRAASASSSA
mmetsp:Transcript_115040/g.330504  ORF Transcript_115040/g.330504 Transcript_115040/m.330504 type:complete len:269 (-) Transcript_115040:1087-1893(-)